MQSLAEEMKGVRIKTLCLAVFCLALVACTRSVVMHSYRNIPAEGWEQSDVLSFAVDTVRESGTLQMDIGVRTTNDYPYQKLWIAVDTELQNPDTAFTDTLACTFVDENGLRNGKGTDTYQYDFHLGEIELQKGQTGRFVVRHIMRREIIPGVCNIGVRLYK